MSAEDLERYETEIELQLYREYRDVLPMFQYVVETERRFYLANDVKLDAKQRERPHLLRAAVARRLGLGHVPPDPLRRRRARGHVQGRQHRGASRQGALMTDERPRGRRARARTRSRGGTPPRATRCSPAIGACGRARSTSSPDGRDTRVLRGEDQPRRCATAHPPRRSRFAKQSRLRRLALQWLGESHERADVLAFRRRVGETRRTGILVGRRARSGVLSSALARAPGPRRVAAVGNGFPGPDSPGASSRCASVGVPRERRGAPRPRALRRAGSRGRIRGIGRAFLPRTAARDERRRRRRVRSNGARSCE